jgi:hypothetical protein
MSSLPAKEIASPRKDKALKGDRSEDVRTFNALFSHSGATWLTGVATRAIEAAKARLRALGINPEDPSSEDEDPKFKLS